MYVREMVEGSMEELTVDPVATNAQVTGAKFNLERNFGWKPDDPQIKKPVDDDDPEAEQTTGIVLIPAPVTPKIIDGDTGVELDPETLKPLKEAQDG